MNDTERLDWLEKQDGGALVSDDGGRWAFASDGFQNVPEDDPCDISTTHFVEKHAWSPSIREALDMAINIEKKEENV